MRTPWVPGMSALPGMTTYYHVLTPRSIKGFNFVNVLCPGLCARDIFVRRIAQSLFVATTFQTIPLFFDFSMILVMCCQPFVGQLWCDKLFHAKRPPYVAAIDSPMLLPRARLWAHCSLLPICISGPGCVSTRVFLCDPVACRWRDNVKCVYCLTDSTTDLKETWRPLFVPFNHRDIRDSDLLFLSPLLFPHGSLLVLPNLCGGSPDSFYTGQSPDVFLPKPPAWSTLKIVGAN